MNFATDSVFGFINLYANNINFRHKKTAVKRLILQIGALREIRTPDPLVRSQVLYPAEL